MAEILTTHGHPPPRQRLHHASAKHFASVTHDSASPFCARSNCRAMSSTTQRRAD